MSINPIALNAGRSSKSDRRGGYRSHRKPYRNPVLEALETRTLLSAITEYPTHTPGALPAGIASGIVAAPGGNLWFTEPGVNKIGMIATNGTTLDFPVTTPSSSPQGITFGPDGNVWFTEAAANKIGVMDTAGNVVHEYPISGPASNPQGITVGPDNNLWFAQAATGQIGVMTATGAIIHEYTIGGGGGQPEGITTGPHGDIWFTLPGTNEIGSINPSTQVVREFPINTAGGRPQSITPGPDGNLWFTEAGAAKIGEISPASATITEYPVPTPGGVTEGIVAGSDGNLWFTEPGSSQIGRITTSGIVTEFAATNPSQPWGITTGPDGNIWATEAVASNVAKVSLAQLISVTGVPVVTQVGNSTTLTIASFKSAALNALPANFTATIDWGDGTTPASGTITASASGGFLVSATKSFSTVGSYLATITIHDFGGASASATSAVTVANFATGNNISPVEGQSFAGQVASFADPQTNGQVGQYTATINWGDSTPSTPGTITFQGGTSFTVAGNHTYAEEGPYTITTSISGPGGRNFVAYGQANVADAPLSAVPVAFSPTIGAPFTGVVATFSDANPMATTADFTATIIWGDGHTSAGTIVAPSPANSFFSVSGSNTYSSAGPFTGTVTIQDKGGASAATSATVRAVAPATGNSIQETEGQFFTAQLATFNDTLTTGQVGQYSATVNWGDGTSSSTGTVIFVGGSTFNVTGSHTYAEEGPYNLTVTLNGPNSRTSVAYGQAIVADAALHSTAAAFAPTAGVPFMGIVATFTDDDPAGTSSDYSATITWGDGHISIGTIGPATTGPPANGFFTVTGTNTYATAGTYDFSVKIADSGGSQITATGMVTVAGSSSVATGSPVTATEGEPFAGPVATFTSSDTTLSAGNFQATINWGNGQVTSGSISGSASPFTVSGVNTYAEEGSYNVVTTITGPGGLKLIATSMATVKDAPLTVLPLSFQAVGGVAFTGTVATFTDANPTPTLSDFSAIIAWGDGDSSTGQIVPSGNGFAVVGTTTYPPGQKSYPVTVQVFDVGGSSALTDKSNALVGFTTGALSGQLAASSISSTFPNITNVNRPAFQGTASPFAVIQLFAGLIYSNPASTIDLGQTISGPDGSWSLTSPRLVDGAYTVTVSMISQAGFPTAPLTIFPPSTPLVIDTTGPRVSGLLFSARTGIVTVVIQDAGAGLDQVSLMNANNYVIMPRRRLVGRLPAGTNVAPAIAGDYSTALSTTLAFHVPLAPGKYLLEIKSAGIIDQAGNPLDGEFSGNLPSGNGRPGGNFVAQITVPRHAMAKPHSKPKIRRPPHRR